MERQDSFASLTESELSFASISTDDPQPSVGQSPPPGAVGPLGPYTHKSQQGRDRLRRSGPKRQAPQPPARPSPTATPLPVTPGTPTPTPSPVVTPEPQASGQVCEGGGGVCGTPDHLAAVSQAAFSAAQVSAAPVTTVRLQFSPMDHQPHHQTQHHAQHQAQHPTHRITKILSHPVSTPSALECRPLSPEGMPQLAPAGGKGPAAPQRSESSQAATRALTNLRIRLIDEESDSDPNGDITHHITTHELPQEHHQPTYDHPQQTPTPPKAVTVSRPPEATHALVVPVQGQHLPRHYHPARAPPGAHQGPAQGMAMVQVQTHNQGQPRPNDVNSLGQYPVEQHLQGPQYLVDQQPQGPQCPVEQNHYENYDFYESFDSFDESPTPPCVSPVPSDSDPSVAMRRGRARRLMHSASDPGVARVRRGPPQHPRAPGVAPPLEHLSEEEPCGEDLDPDMIRGHRLQRSDSIATVAHLYEDVLVSSRLRVRVTLTNLTVVVMVAALVLPNTAIALYTTFRLVFGTLFPAYYSIESVVRGRGRGRGRPRGRGKEVKGRGRGKKKDEDEDTVGKGVEKGGNKDSSGVRGRGRGRGRGKVRQLSENSQEFDTHSASEVTQGDKVKQVKISVNTSEGMIKTPPKEGLSSTGADNGTPRADNISNLNTIEDDANMDTLSESSSKIRNLLHPVNSDVDEVCEKRVGESRHRIIQVKSPEGVRQVVVLNSVKAGLLREPLIKIIPPKDPPKEEEKTPSSKRGPKKEKLTKGEKPKSISEKDTGINRETNTGTPVKKSIYKTLEDVGLDKKKGEMQRRKIEEIQRRREEILKKREAIMQRKLQEKKEMGKQHSPNTPESKPKAPESTVHVKTLDSNGAHTPKDKHIRRQILIMPKKSLQTPDKKSVVTPEKKTIITLNKKPSVAVEKVVGVTEKKAVSDRVQELQPGDEESPVRRSGRAIKKKTFGDEMVTFDLKEEIKSEDAVEDEGLESELEEDDDDESLEDYGQDDDPERLWCICQKPHNNRFMICCDKCEDWFHGTCVGISKIMGRQMEAEGQDWVCPKCKKIERTLKGGPSPSKKVGQSPVKVHVGAPGTPPGRPQGASLHRLHIGKKKVLVKSKSQGPNRFLVGGVKRTLPLLTPAAPRKIVEGDSKLEKKTLYKEGERKLEKKVILAPGEKKLQKKVFVMEGEKKSERRVIVTHAISQPLEGSTQPGKKPVVVSTSRPEQRLEERKKCVVESCYKASKDGSIYCSDDCVLKHAQMSLKVLGKSDKDLEVQHMSAASKAAMKGEARVLVYHKTTGKISSGTSAPTITQLKEWLKDNPDYAVLQPDMMGPQGVVASPQTKQIPSTKFYGEKKVIQVSSQGLPVPGQSSRKVTVVKSSDGKIIVKSSENSGKDTPSKAALQTPSKSLVVSSSLKASGTPTSSQKSEDAKNRNVFGKMADTKDDYTPSKSTPKDAKKVVQRATSTEKKKPDTIDLRENIRKGLTDALVNRAKGADKEFSHMSDSGIRHLASVIEKELYYFFNKDIGFKYKSRYRSLIFNIKDAKNSGLFRKILNGTISPSNLAKMTSEELASKELAEWRKGEEQKELQAIEKHELDMIALGNQYIMKSHKGEIEIDKDDFIKDKEKAPETLNSLPADSVEDIELKNSSLDTSFKSLDDLDLKINKDSYNESKQKKESGREHRHKDGDKGRKDRHSDRRDRRDSSDKERRRRKSSDADKDRKHRDKKDRDDKHRSRDKDGEKNSSKDRERERHKSSSSDKDRRDRKDSKDKKDDRDRKHKDKSKDRRDSKDKDRRRDSERSDRKRKHSESHSDDKKRRDSERDRRKDNDKDKRSSREKQKDEVSTSEDVVKDPKRRVTVDDDIEELPSSTVTGSPDIMELKDPVYGTRKGSSPVLFSNSPEMVDLSEPDFSSKSPVPYPRPSDSPIYTPQPMYMPPLPEDDLPLPPPLPESPRTPPLPDDFPNTPPLPDDSPMTPPFPDDDFPCTPPLPDESASPDDGSNTPPYPSDSALSRKEMEDDLNRMTPPLVFEKGSTPPKVISAEAVTVWKGLIHMPETAKFAASAFEVSGKAQFLPDDVPNTIGVVGRIAPETVWTYIAQMKKSGSKEILVVRFQPSNEDEKVSYIALYSYLSSKKRYGVIGNCGKSVKDFYIVPLASHQPIPQVLLPLDGPGFEEHRAHMLIGVIVRSKQRRVYDRVSGTWKMQGAPATIPPTSHKHQDTTSRSYTPPLPTEEDIREIALAAKDSPDEDLDEERSYTPPPTDLYSGKSAEPLAGRSSALKRSAKEENTQANKRFAGDQSDEPFHEEPNTPPDEGTAEASLDQESMLAELNRQIEKHKKELSEMQKTIGNDDEEPYSPSRSHTPPLAGQDALKVDTSKISIPSNLQEILDNIKQKEDEIKQKEQEIKRRKSLSAADPIVMNYGKYQEKLPKSVPPPVPKPVPPPMPVSSQGDVDLRPLLQKQASKDVDLRVLQKSDEKSKEPAEAAKKPEEDTDLRVRDPRLARAQAAAAQESKEKGKTLSKMSDEELLAKALEMESENTAPQPAAAAAAAADPVFTPISFSVPPPNMIPPGAPILPPAAMGPPPPLPPPPGIIPPTFQPPVGPYGRGARLPAPPGHFDPIGPSGHLGPPLPPGHVGPPGPRDHHGPPPDHMGHHGHRYADNWEGGNYGDRGWGPNYDSPRERDREWYARGRGRPRFPYRQRFDGRRRWEGRDAGREWDRDREDSQKDTQGKRDGQEGEEDEIYPPEIDY